MRTYSVKSSNQTARCLVLQDCFHLQHGSHKSSLRFKLSQNLHLLWRYQLQTHRNLSPSSKNIKSCSKRWNPGIQPKSYEEAVLSDLLITSAPCHFRFDQKHCGDSNISDVHVVIINNNPVTSVTTLGIHVEKSCGRIIPPAVSTTT